MLPPEVKYVGIAWFKRKNYKRLRNMFIDGRKLPISFDKWLQQAQCLFEGLQRDGRTVVKVDIDPEAFPEWCRVHSLDVDARARVRFSDEFVAREYLYKD